jgi:hypothetical protein
VDKSGTCPAAASELGNNGTNLPGTTLVARTHFGLGRPVVAVRFNGPTIIVLADHEAPDWMITAAIVIASNAQQCVPMPRADHV